MTALERYVHVTTPEVYGSTEGWVREDAPFNPSTPYAVSRAAGDMSLRTYFANYQFPVVFTRAANVYGPGQQLYRIVPRTIVAAMGGAETAARRRRQIGARLHPHERRHRMRPSRSPSTGTPGTAYHISGYELVSIRTLVEMILERLGQRSRIASRSARNGPARIPPIRSTASSCAPNSAGATRFSLEQGIDDVIRLGRTLRRRTGKTADEIRAQAVTTALAFGPRDWRATMNLAVRPTAGQPDAGALKKQAARLAGESSRCPTRPRPRIWPHRCRAATS